MEGVRRRSGSLRPRRASKRAWAWSGRTTQRIRSSRPSVVGMTMSALLMRASSSRMVRVRLRTRSSFVRISVENRKQVGWHYTRLSRQSLRDSAHFTPDDPTKKPASAPELRKLG